MDLKIITQKLDKELGIQVNLKAFGRTRELMWECRSSELIQIARWLKDGESTRLDCLDNFSVYEIKNKLVFTYFLRSRALMHDLILKTEIPLDGTGRVHMDSVSSIWPMAQAFEEESKSLMGVEFEGKIHQDEVSSEFKKSNDQYPLRKDYTWDMGIV